MKSPQNTRVVVGLSGGVDSSVTAYLLKAQGYKVIGIFMRNWNDESVILDDECPWVEDSADALLVAEKLGIPFQVIDLSEVYKERIVDYMFDEYEKGRTPNPDVLCNREIKFDVFLKTAEELGADFVATGHYCRKEETQINGTTTYRLLAGVDPNKDQSYFLCQLSQSQLAKSLFPIGHLQKPEVRKIAEQQKLATAQKKDSQGLCFIGKVRLPDFLQQKLKPKTGNIIEIPSEFTATKKGHTLEIHSEMSYSLARLKTLAKDYTYRPNDGKVVGTHSGAHFFTRGQRKGLAVGGTPLPLFVLETDVETNTIYVGQGEDHPGLYKSVLFITREEVHWVRPDLAPKNQEPMEVLARIRYRQELQKAWLYSTTEGCFVVFESPQKAIAKGQFCAWYLGEELIGSGVIS